MVVIRKSIHILAVISYVLIIVYAIVCIPMIFGHHRIANIDNGFIETKGDANKVSDVNKIRYENVRGKVGKLSIPYVGYYIKTVNDNLTLVVIVTIIILVSEFLISNTEAFDINNKNGRSEKDAEN